MSHDDFDPEVWDRMCDFAGWACVAICTVAALAIVWRVVM